MTLEKSPDTYSSYAQNLNSCYIYNLITSLSKKKITKCHKASKAGIEVYTEIATLYPLRNFNLHLNLWREI